jgi:hypothetical protein
MPLSPSLPGSGGHHAAHQANIIGKTARTRPSLERTLMSWIRTAVSLIGFDFTIVQFFERMQDLPGVNPARHPASPRFAVSIWQYHWTIRYPWSESFARRSRG